MEGEDGGGGGWMEGMDGLGWMDGRTDGWMEKMEG